MQKNFEENLTNFLYDQIPLTSLNSLKIIRNDNKTIQDIKIPKDSNEDFFKFLEEIDNLKIKIVKLLIDDRSTFISSEVKSYKLLLNNVFFEVKNISGNGIIKERIVQIKSDLNNSARVT